MKLAEHRLSTCFTNHKQCGHNNISPQWYPTGLLEIWEMSVRLPDTSCHHICGAYATLSHCWGTKAFECLTEENKAVCKCGIPRLNLPRTFQDAMCIAQRLVIRYLWIDSYGIVQSSGLEDSTFTNDKIAEIARMKDVYTNTIVNLGAAHGVDPHSGCFAKREHYLREPDRFRWRPSARDPEKTFRIREHHAIRAKSGLYGQIMFQRAWVMQERMLTSRMLHFCDRQPYWGATRSSLPVNSIPMAC